MSNICCDDVCFHAGSNPKGLQNLWDDLEASIMICSNPDKAWIGNLFRYKRMPTSGIGLRGTVTYMERNAEGILLDLSTAWSPLYDAYHAIARHYSVPFVCKSVEPGCGIYFNTDAAGDVFPEKYIITIGDEDAVAPVGKKITEALEDGDVFSCEQELLNAFRSLGYAASSAKELEALLEDDGIDVHEFINPYAAENAAA